MTQLRPYQCDCIDAVMTAARNGRDHQLIVMATGLGKTIVFVELAKLATGRTLILAHRTELIDQAKDKLISAGVDRADVGVIRAGENETDRRYTVASVQTLCQPKRLDQLPRDSFSLMVIDEAHHVMASTYRKILDRFDTRLVVGVTATPTRLDGRGLDELFGAEAVFTYGIREGIDDRWLVPIRQFQIHTNADLSRVHTRAGDFAVGELGQAVNTHLRNKLIVDSWTNMAYGRATVAFTVDVQHAVDLATEFRRQGFHAMAVHAETPKDERKAILARLATDRLDAVTNCAILTEGWDAPSISCVLMARPTKSRGLYTQCVGRGLRIHDGKNDCLILDTTDNCKKHKLITIGDLFGVTTADFEGRTVDEVERHEREQVTKRIAVGPTSWTAEEIPAFLPTLLEGYTPRERWHDDPATPKQIHALHRAGFNLGEHRLTKGEGCFLHNQARRKRDTGPPTSKQAWFLRRHGVDPNHHTFETASALIGRMKAEVA